MSYDSLIIPAKVIASISLLNASDIAADEPKLWGPIGGFNTLVQCVQAMFAYKFVIQTNQTLWNNFLNRLSFGLIKKTLEYGTTSVSFGVAQTCEWKESDLIIAFGNGGTEGLKIEIVEQVQLFDSRRFLKMGFESKNTGNEPNINAVQLSQWIPEKQSDMVTECKKLGICIQKWKEQFKKRRFPSRIKILTFTTGPSRAAWECASEEEKDAMETQVKVFYNCHNDKDIIFEPWNGKSFFMTQKEEADMEAKATSALYKNLIDAKLLSENVTVIDNWGMGFESCQFGEHLGVSIGMKSCQNLIFADIVTQFQRELTRGLAAEWLALSQTYPADAKLVIALKSGFALLLTDKTNPWLLKSITR